MLYKWLVAASKAVSYYYEKAPIMKEPKRIYEQQIEPVIDKLQEIIKTHDKTIEELKETNEELRNTNTRLKVELKNIQNQYINLMKLVDVIINDETLDIPEEFSIDIFKY